jgi:hypothetical protein
MRAGLMDRGAWLLCAALVVHSGCGSTPLEVDLVAVDVTGPVTLTVGSPVEFVVTATNNRAERVVWGIGSSSCQLSLFVEGDELELHNIAFRACTVDLAEQGLDPGQTRTEVIAWDGHISVSGLMAALPAGVYQVTAMAGDEFESPQLTVTIVEP